MEPRRRSSVHPRLDRLNGGAIGPVFGRPTVEADLLLAEGDPGRPRCSGGIALSDVELVLDVRRPVVGRTRVADRHHVASALENQLLVGAGGLRPRPRSAFFHADDVRPKGRIPSVGNSRDRQPSLAQADTSPWKVTGWTFLVGGPTLIRCSSPRSAWCDQLHHARWLGWQAHPRKHRVCASGSRLRRRSLLSVLSMRRRTSCLAAAPFSCSSCQ